MELIEAGDLPKAEKLLQSILAIDENFVAAHTGMVGLYQAGGFDEGVREFTESGYKQTRKQFPGWPKELLWGVLENRQYLRAIANKAMQYHEGDEKESAAKLYRVLLRLNPHDNQGIRYLLAGLYADISPHEVDAMFDHGNSAQDWSDLERLLDEQNAQHGFWKVPKDY